MLRVSGAQKVLRLNNTLHVQLITFWGSRFERKWMIPKNDPQDDPAGISSQINKVLARISYMSGLFDSKLLVKQVVWRKTNIRGVAFINPRWGLIQGGALQCPWQHVTMVVVATRMVHLERMYGVCGKTC